MDINLFMEKVAEGEGKAVQVNIAQIKEVIRVANDLLEDKVYQAIREAR